jgi:hypothetical protein
MDMASHLPSQICGISISKSNLLLTIDHILELQQSNVNVLECNEKYILYYAPNPYPTTKQEIHHLKGILTRIRCDEIYNSYTDDFGIHAPKIDS